MPESIQIPPEISAEKVRPRAFPSYSAPFDPVQEFEPEKPSLPLTHYLWILRRHLWKMLGFVAACVLITFIVSTRLKPVYESTATINIDPQAPAAVVGQGTTNQSGNVDTDIFFTTQMRIIQSDSVLRPVAEQFHLIGSDGSKGEDTLDSQSLASAPVFLGASQCNASHEYLPPANQLPILQSRLAASIANAIAKSYLDQVYNLHTRSSADLSSFMGEQLDSLKAKMERSSQALAKFEKDMDVINPEQKTDILSARLQQLNSEYSTAQADRIAKESTWNAVKSGSAIAALSASQGRRRFQIE